MRAPAPRWLAPTVDYGPLAVFFVAYMIFDIVKATAAMLVATIIVFFGLGALLVGACGRIVSTPEDEADIEEPAPELAPERPV